VTNDASRLKDISNDIAFYRIYMIALLYELMRISLHSTAFFIKKNYHIYRGRSFEFPFYDFTTYRLNVNRQR